MGINEARGTGWRERARILRVEDMGLPITIVSERLALPRGSQSPVSIQRHA